ncbi:MAG: 3'-5' exonuclease [Anaerolineae bacterium]|nr:3'-5' exonuclease [Anaerolineae bacterium]
MTTGTFETFAIVELMGHARIAGKVSEANRFGTVLMRVDVPKTSQRDGYTKFYSASSIYCITPTDEATAQAAAERFNEPAVQPWIVPLPTSPLLAEKVVVARDDDYPHIPDEPEDPYLGEDDDYDEWPDDDDDDDDDDFDDFLDDDDEDEPPTSAHRDNLASAVRRAADLVRSPFVIFDTETTGFDPSDEIIQIAVIDQDGNTLLNSLIKPVRPIRNSAYHGITDEMVADAPDFKTLYPQIRAALHGKTVLAYNLEYDERMLRQDCERHGCEVIISPDSPYVSACVMLLYAEYHGEWNEYHGNYRWQKLSTAISALGLEWDGRAHDALADAKATLAVLKALADRITVAG